MQGKITSDSDVVATRGHHFSGQKTGLGIPGDVKPVRSEQTLFQRGVIHIKACHVDDAFETHIGHIVRIEIQRSL